KFVSKGQKIYLLLLVVAALTLTIFNRFGCSINKPKIVQELQDSFGDEYRDEPIPIYEEPDFKYEPYPGDLFEGRGG
ncbi:MAG TPA: hypothetical protein VFD57_00890, partial [Clostridia bacterium]|nr:hypothetical protein [Clostridia bacterium]